MHINSSENVYCYDQKVFSFFLPLYLFPSEWFECLYEANNGYDVMKMMIIQCQAEAIFLWVSLKQSLIKRIWMIVLSTFLRPKCSTKGRRWKKEINFSKKDFVRLIFYSMGIIKRVYWCNLSAVETFKKHKFLHQKKNWEKLKRKK